MDPRVVAGLVVALYLALVLPTVARHGISWDEQTDLTVASAYADAPAGWLLGSDLEAYNVRLPAYAAGLIFAVIGEPSLLAARLLACAIGAATLVAVFLFARWAFDPRTGLIAAAILATCPFFLANAKSGFTDGDIFVTGALAWVLLCLERLRRRPSVGRAALAGVALGVALASKVSAIAAFPVAALVPFLSRRGEAPGDAELPGPAAAILAALLALLAASVLGGWLLAGAIGIEHYGPDRIGFVAGHYAFVAAAWLAVLGAAAHWREALLDRGRAALFAPLLGALTFFVIPPVHTTNPEIVGGLAGALFFSNEAFSWAFLGEAAALHFTSVLLKPSPVIGAALWTCAVLAALAARRREELRLPLLLLAAYGLFVLRLPWAQTYYTMPMLPILALLCADQLVRLFDARRATAVAVAAFAAGVLAADLARAYPDLHLNGYQWIGARHLAGRSTLGSRSVARLPADGVEQAVRFVDERAAPGETVVTFANPSHIVRAVAGDPDYRLIEGRAGDGALADADWVVTSLNAELRRGYGPGRPEGPLFDRRYDAEYLRAQFTRVFAVRRAFGLEVAAVWRRKPEGGESGDS